MLTHVYWVYMLYTMDYMMAEGSYDENRLKRCEMHHLSPRWVIIIRPSFFFWYQLIFIAYIGCILWTTQRWKVATTKMGSNDTRHVVWALGASACSLLHLSGISTGFYISKTSSVWCLACLACLAPVAPEVKLQLLNISPNTSITKHDPAPCPIHIRSGRDLG